MWVLNPSRIRAWSRCPSRPGRIPGTRRPWCPTRRPVHRPGSCWGVHRCQAADARVDPEWQLRACRARRGCRGHAPHHRRRLLAGSRGSRCGRRWRCAPADQDAAAERNGDRRHDRGGAPGDTAPVRGLRVGEGDLRFGDQVQSRGCEPLPQVVFECTVVLLVVLAPGTRRRAQRLLVTVPVRPRPAARPGTTPAGSGRVVMRRRRERLLRSWDDAGEQHVGIVHARGEVRDRGRAAVGGPQPEDAVG